MSDTPENIDDDVADADVANGEPGATTDTAPSGDGADDDERAVHPEEPAEG